MDYLKTYHVKANKYLESKLRETKDDLRASLWFSTALFLYGAIITVCYVMDVK